LFVTVGNAGYNFYDSLFDRQKLRKTNFVQLASTAAVNVTLLAFASDDRAAVRRAAAAPLLLGAERPCNSRSISCPPVGPTAANPPHVAASA